MQPIDDQEDLIEIRNKIEQLEYLEARYGELDDEYDDLPSVAHRSKAVPDKPKGKPREKQRRKE